MPDALDRLAGVPLFSGCGRADLRRLHRASDELVLDAGTVMCREGELGREVFVLVDGTAEVSRSGVPIAGLDAGAVIGELSLLDGGPRTATVTATSPVRVLVLTRPAFNAVLDEVPTLAHKLLVALAKRLRAAEDAWH